MCVNRAVDSAAPALRVCVCVWMVCEAGGARCACVCVCESMIECMWTRVAGGRMTAQV